MAARSASEERFILDLCDEILSTPTVRQGTFDWLRGDPSSNRPQGTMLPVDGY